MQLILRKNSVLILKQVLQVLLQKVEIVQQFVVRQHLLLDLRIINPSNEIFHRARNVISRVCNDFGANSDLTLFDKRDRFF